MARTVVYLEDLLDGIRPLVSDALYGKIRTHARATAGAEIRHKGRAANLLERAGIRRLAHASVRDLADEPMDALQEAHDLLHADDRALGDQNRRQRALAHARVVSALRRRGRDHEPRAALDYAGVSPESLDDLQKADHAAALEDGDLLRAHRALHAAWPTAHDFPRSLPPLMIPNLTRAAWVAHGHQTGLAQRLPLLKEAVRSLDGWQAVCSRDLDGTEYALGLARLSPWRAVGPEEFARLEERHRVDDATRRRIFKNASRYRYADVLEHLPFERPVPAAQQDEDGRPVAGRSGGLLWLDGARLAQPFGALDGDGLWDVLRAHETLAAEIRKRDLMPLDGDKMSADAAATASGRLMADLEAHFGTLLASPSVPPDIREAVREFFRGPHRGGGPRDLRPLDPFVPQGPNPKEPIPGLSEDPPKPVRAPADSGPGGGADALGLRGKQVGSGYPRGRDPEDPERRPYPAGPASGGPVQRSGPTGGEVHVDRPLTNISIAYLQRSADPAAEAAFAGGLLAELDGAVEGAQRLLEAGTDERLRKASAAFVDALAALRDWDQTVKQSGPGNGDRAVALEKPGLEETGSEFRYRLRDPGKVKVVGQKVITTSPHRIWALFGKPGGRGDSTVMQSLRFPKGDGWTEVEVRSYLREHPDLAKWNPEDSAGGVMGPGGILGLQSDGRQQADPGPGGRNGGSWRGQKGGPPEEFRTHDDDSTRWAPAVREFLDALAPSRVLVDPKRKAADGDEAPVDRLAPEALRALKDYFRGHPDQLGTERRDSGVDPVRDPAGYFRRELLEPEHEDVRARLRGGVLTLADLQAWIAGERRERVGKGEDVRFAACECGHEGCQGKVGVTFENKIGEPCGCQDPGCQKGQEWRGTTLGKAVEEAHREAAADFRADLADRLDDDGLFWELDASLAKAADTDDTSLNGKQTLAVDFDGTIAEHEPGEEFVAHKIPGGPIKGAKAALAALRRRYRVAVYSARAGTPRGRDAVKAWLDRHGIEVDAVPTAKPPAVAYVDDKAMPFDGNWDAIAHKLLQKADAGQTVVDYLTSRLHDGYARSADAVYALGHLTQDQRKSVGKAVGEAIKVYRDRMRDLAGDAACDTVIPPENLRAAIQKRAAAVRRAALAEQIATILKLDEKRQITGVVLEPGVVDTQGDVYDEDMVREAAHDFLANWRTLQGDRYERGFGEQHKKPARQIELLESYVTPQALTIGRQTVPKGTWIITVKVLSDGLWRDVKAGRYTGFSIGGYGEGKPAAPSEVERLVDDRERQVKLAERFHTVTKLLAGDGAVAKDGRGTKRRMLTKREVRYAPVWTNREETCRRCSMYDETDRAQDGVGQGFCSILFRSEGTVNAGGHCDQFAPSGEDAEARARVPVGAVGKAGPEGAAAVGGSGRALTGTPCLVLVRHGKTDSNRGGVGKDLVRGSLDMPLDGTGEREAHRLAVVLQDEPLTAVYSSDLGRTMTTAKMIADQHNLPVRPEPSLRSWALGDLEGQLVDGEVVRAIEDLVRHPDRTPPGGGEPFDDWMRNLLGFVDRAIDACEPGDCFALVTHARDIQAVELWLRAGRDSHRLAQRYADELATEPDSVKPGGFVRLEPGPDGEWHVSERHLEGERVSHPAS